ncbi:MAG: dihydrofolate reductase family protein [Bacteroidota bacterium]
MRMLTAFTFVTLNGFFKGPGEDTTWHHHGKEEAKFSEQSLRRGNILLFGRKTYEMMAAFWPTPMAKEAFPKVADGMNKAEKLVFSRTMKNAEWHNTRVVGKNLIEAVRGLKRTAKKDMTILGSGSLVAQLAQEGLIDEYEILVDPIAIGNGTPLFKDMTNRLDLKLSRLKQFKSGAVLLRFHPLTASGKKVLHKT